MIWWPVVQQRLVELLPTLTGWDDVKVYDTVRLEDLEAKSFVIVGGTTPDPDSGAFDIGSWENVEEAVTGMRAERGTVLCELSVWGGDNALPAYQAAVFALADALDEEIRREQRLGVLPDSSTTDLAADLISIQASSGAEQRLLLSVRYFTRS